MNYESQSEAYDAAIATAKEQGAAKFNGLLRELAALLVPHIMSHPDMVKALAFDPALIEDVVQSKMDELGPIDRDMVREVCEEVVDASDIEDKISDYMCNSFDISDYESEIKHIVDVRDELEDMLPDAVYECVQNLQFAVHVTSR